MKVISLKTAPESGIISQAVKVFQTGGLVIYPTETVYGAGVDAANSKAVVKLSKFKSRPFGKPFSIAVPDQKMAAEYVELNDTAKKLYRQFLPGPLTVVSTGRHRTAPGVESETGTLGIRIPAYSMVIKIVKALGRPITATSANAAYKRRPYKISDIVNQISDKKKRLIDLIIDAGELPRNEPSTVIDTTMDDLVLLRIGNIKFKDKNEILSRGPEATQNLAKELWQKYEQFAGQRAIVFALEGPMGAGKTQFTKGLARAMGVRREVTSPTFNLVNAYDNLVHFDAWRMESAGELEGLNFAKTISDKSVIAVEWADRVADVIKKFNQEAIIIWIKIVYGEGENERLIEWGTI